MPRRARNWLTYSNVMATTAVFIALGGSSYAAITLKKGQVKSRHIAKNAINSGKVKNRSLRARDFKAGQLPAAARGPAGARGPQGVRGARGPAGSPDTPAQVRDKLMTVDGNGSGVDADLLDGLSSSAFLPVGGKAADADQLDGINSSGFITGGPGVAAAGRLTFSDGLVDPDEVGSVLLNLPFLGQLQVDGCDGTNGRVNFNTVGNGAVYVFDNHTGLTNPVAVVSGNYVGPTIPKGAYMLSVGRNTTGNGLRMATIWVAFNGDDCTFQAQGMMHGTTG